MSKNIFLGSSDFRFGFRFEIRDSPGILKIAGGKTI